MKPVFRLYASCIPVLGKDESIICNLLHRTYRYIPNALYEIVTDYSDLSIDEICAIYNNKEIVESYFEFLSLNDFGFWTDSPDNFPPLDLTWKSPEEIANSILEIRYPEEYDVLKVLEQLDMLGCKYIELRFLDNVPFQYIEEILLFTNYNQLRTIDIYLPWDEKIMEDIWQAVFTKFKKINSMVIYSSPEGKNSGERVKFVSHELSSSNLYFKETFHTIINIEFFAESLKFNTYYNKKVCIDSFGNIKNCHSLPESYGNVNFDEIEKVIKSEDFRELWNACPDQILELKDSPTRYLTYYPASLKKVGDGYYSSL